MWSGGRALEGEGEEQEEEQEEDVGPGVPTGWEEEIFSMIYFQFPNLTDPEFIRYPSNFPK
jgi:hypothetical protein